jgi:hypothetical protein
MAGGRPDNDDQPSVAAFAANAYDESSMYRRLWC